MVLRLLRLWLHSRHGDLLRRRTMEAIMNPTTADESRTPIAAPEAEAAAVVELRDFMAAKPAGERRHASLRSPDGHQLEIPNSIYRVLVAATVSYTHLR